MTGRGKVITDETQLQLMNKGSEDLIEDEVDGLNMINKEETDSDDISSEILEKHNIKDQDCSLVVLRSKNSEELDLIDKEEKHFDLINKNKNIDIDLIDKGGDATQIILEPPESFKNDISDI